MINEYRRKMADPTPPLAATNGNGNDESFDVSDSQFFPAVGPSWEFPPVKFKSAVSPLDLHPGELMFLFSLRLKIKRTRKKKEKGGETGGNSLTGPFNAARKGNAPETDGDL